MRNNLQTATVFLDTNVLVYAAIGTGKDERKRQRALALIESEEFGMAAFTPRSGRLGTAPGNSWIVTRHSCGCGAVSRSLVRTFAWFRPSVSRRIGMNCARAIFLILTAFAAAAKPQELSIDFGPTQNANCLRVDGCTAHGSWEFSAGAGAYLD